jgi:hypothetical protein
VPNKKQKEWRFEPERDGECCGAQQESGLIWDLPCDLGLHVFHAHTLNDVRGSGGSFHPFLNAFNAVGFSFLALLQRVGPVRSHSAKFASSGLCPNSDARTA